MSTLDQEKKPSSYGRLWALIGLVAGLLILAFVIHRAVADLRDLRAFEWHLRPLYLVLSFLILGLHYPVYAVSLKLLVDTKDSRLPFRAFFKVLFTSQMGKYIPGKVWSVVGLAVLISRRGGKPGRAVGAQVAQNLLNTATGLVFWGLAALVCARFLEAGICLAAGLIGLLAMAFPGRSIFQWLINRAMRVLKREPVDLDISAHTVGLSELFCMLDWIVMGVAFWLLLISFVPLDLNALPTAMRALTIAQLAGLWAIIVPGGIGVREGTMALMLSELLKSAVASAVSIGARLWSLTGDLLALAVALSL